MFKKIGFGGYRVDVQNQEHLQALKSAYKAGIRHIDTSSNYTGGNSEKAVAQFLKLGKREEFTLITKAGYMQGNTQNKFANQLNSIEVVRYNPRLFHSIHPMFIEDQLNQSLTRLETDYIDIYMLHNPEYYILSNVHNQNDVAKHQKEMYRRIYNAFVLLEKKVQEGVIKKYGISSNSFSLPNDNMHFLPYEGLVDLALKAANSVGVKESSFKAVELPINLLETTGLECAKWSKENGLLVVTNRPLNAMNRDGRFRLASYEEDKEYMKNRSKLVKIAHDSGANFLFNAIHILEEKSGKFEDLDEINMIFNRRVNPAVRPLIDRMKNSNEVHQLLDQILYHYEKQEKYNVSQQTKKYLESQGYSIDKNIECKAIRFLTDQPNIDVVLVGMLKPGYVDSVVSCFENS